MVPRSGSIVAVQNVIPVLQREIVRMDFKTAMSFILIVAGLHAPFVKVQLVGKQMANSLWETPLLRRP